MPPDISVRSASPTESASSWWSSGPPTPRAMLPVAAVLAGALAITAIIDMANGTVPLLGETIHLPELLSVLLIWLLAVPGPRRAARAEKKSDRGLHAA